MCGARHEEEWGIRWSAPDIAQHNQQKKGSVSVDTSRQQGAGTYGLGPLLGVGVVLFKEDKDLLANSEAGRDGVVERRALDVQPFPTTTQQSATRATDQEVNTHTPSPHLLSSWRLARFGMRTRRLSTECTDCTPEPTYGAKSKERRAAGSSLSAKFKLGDPRVAISSKADRAVCQT